MKNKVDKLDVYKLVPASLDLRKLSDVAKMMLPKNVYNAQIKITQNKTVNITK